MNAWWWFWFPVLSFIILSYIWVIFLQMGHNPQKSDKRKQMEALIAVLFSIWLSYQIIQRASKPWTVEGLTIAFYILVAVCFMTYLYMHLIAPPWTCLKCHNDGKSKCVCPPAPQKLSKKEQRQMDLMSALAIEELLEKKSRDSLHLCRRCMKYVSKSRITIQRTYAGEAVCNTCNLGMQDDA